MTFADKVLVFYRQLAIEERLPRGVEILNPYQNDRVFALCREFYKKYYDDNLERAAILGINPGRFGAGLTGIPFTDPVKLEQRCGIPNELPKKAELSADFIYHMMDAYGGHEKFYRRFFINSLSPLGFVHEGRNLNYYDTPALIKSLERFIVRSLYQQIDLGISRKVAFCLGEGANFKYLTRINQQEKFFGKIIPLAHPRFIMQYRRKSAGDYVAGYISKFHSIDSPADA